MTIERKMDEVDEKLSRVDDTTVVMGMAQELIDTCKEGLEEKITENEKEFNGKISKIYKEELY